MNFTQVFKASASGKMVANYTIDPEILLPNKYESRDTKENALLSLLGGGERAKRTALFRFFYPHGRDISAFVHHRRCRHLKNPGNTWRNCPLPKQCSIVGLSKTLCPHHIHGTLELFSLFPERGTNGNLCGNRQKQTGIQP